MNRSAVRTFPALLLAAACTDHTVSPNGPPPNTPAAVMVVAGDSQTAEVAATLPLPLRFRVLNSVGTPLPGETLDVAVTAGQGGSVSVPSLVTGSLGEATDVWTLGIRAGQQSIAARTRTSISGTPLVAAATAFATPGPLAITFFTRSRAHLLGESVWVTKTVALDSFSNRLPTPPIADLDDFGTTQQGESTFTVVASIQGRFRFVLGQDTLVVVVLAPAGRMRLVHYRGDTVETLTGRLVVARWLDSGGATPFDSSFADYDLIDAVATRSIGGTQTDSVGFPRLSTVILDGVPWVIDSTGNSHPWIGRWWTFTFHEVIWPDGIYDSLTHHQVAFTGPGPWIARGLQYGGLGPSDSLTIR